uniref:Phosphotriesterase-related protein n=1 Tax=Clastoptera arizonana TaxID=38151 RepID=A0A1B6C6M9_9HEMI
MIQSVKGPLAVGNLGRTLTHEHLQMDFNVMYSSPPKQLERFFNNKINIENVGFIKQYPYGSRYNLNFNDKEAEEGVIEDVQFYKECGGSTIVENTSIGLKRNIPFLVKVSEKTGVNIVAGTGK